MNKRPPRSAHEQRIQTSVQNAQDAEWALRKAKRAAGLPMARRQASSASRIAICKTCKAPVVDSLVGWKAHWARMPLCTSVE